MTVIEFEDMLEEAQRMALEIRAERGRNVASARLWEQALPLARGVIIRLQRLPEPARMTHTVMSHDEEISGRRPAGLPEPPQLPEPLAVLRGEAEDLYQELRDLYWKKFRAGSGRAVFEP